MPWLRRCEGRDRRVLSRLRRRGKNWIPVGRRSNCRCQWLNLHPWSSLPFPKIVLICCRAATEWRWWISLFIIYSSPFYFIFALLPPFSNKTFSYFLYRKVIIPDYFDYIKIITFNQLLLVKIWIFCEAYHFLIMKS